MTLTHPAALAGPASAGPASAPLLRLVRSELALTLRRPHTLVSLTGFALLPVVIGFGIGAGVTGQVGEPAGGEGRQLLAAASANGLSLPVTVLAVSLALLLPLTVSLAAADAFAGETARGTLRALLLAPVGRLRLVGVKALGVLTVTVLSVAVVSVSSLLAGTLIVGDAAGGGRLLTLSGNTVEIGSALGRVAAAAGWSALQLAAVAAVALAVSAFANYPHVVPAMVMSGAIVSDVLAAIPSLNWLRPWLLTSGWPTLSDLLRDPVPTDNLTGTALIALGYLAAGLAVAVAGMLTRKA